MMQAGSIAAATTARLLGMFVQTWSWKNFVHALIDQSRRERQRPRRSKSKMAPPTKKRKIEVTAVEEIAFDTSARQDWLTGFHKRKLERAKHAREIAEKKARAERVEQRKQVRTSSS